MQDVIPQILRSLPDVHIVGGAVRDLLLGKEGIDVDLATSATPQEVIERLTKENITVIPTGIDHGTVTAIIEEEQYEITTFRLDVATDGRRATVSFAKTIEEDLARRDFTINALALNMKGELIDPFAGAADLQAGVIRAVGNPRDRFKEDYLRIIRAARFAGRYGFTIEPYTFYAMVELAPRVLPNVSIERVVDEFNKAFEDEIPSAFLTLMYRLEILPKLIPEFVSTHLLMQNPEHHPEGDVLAHVLQVIDHAPPSHRWHALLHDIGKKDTAALKEGEDYCTFYGHEKIGADIIPRIAADLKLPNDLRDSLIITTRYHMQPLFMEKNGVTTKAIRKLQANVGEYLDDLRIVCNADSMGRRKVDQRIFEPDETVRPVLMGRHLIDAGFTPGPEFSKILRAAYEHQIEYGVVDEEELLKIATDSVVAA